MSRPTPRTHARRAQLLGTTLAANAWVRGNTSINGTALDEGDGAAVTGETSLTFEGGDAEVLVFDLA